VRITEAERRALADSLLMTGLVLKRADWTEEGRLIP
jgi:hypothetical protein